MHISQLLVSATEQLNGLSESPRLDAEILLAHSLDKNRTWLMTWPEKTPTQTQLDHFQHLLLRRMAGEPVAHITGSREFWSLPLTVTKDTLIPRPDTELLVEQILARYPENTEIKLADLGTGSGAIALALAAERANWSIVATDRSSAALEIARLNASQLKLSNITFKQGSWLEPLKGMIFDVIASNPPYIPSADPHLTQGDVRFEPLSALTSGEDGLDDIRLIAEGAKRHLKPGGMLIIEHGFDQKTEIREIFTLSGYKKLAQHHDLAGNPRITLGFIP